MNPTDYDLSEVGLVFGTTGVWYWKDSSGQKFKNESKNVTHRVRPRHSNCFCHNWILVLNLELFSKRIATEMTPTDYDLSEVGLVFGTTGIWYWISKKTTNPKINETDKNNRNQTLSKKWLQPTTISQKLVLFLEQPVFGTELSANLSLPRSPLNSAMTIMLDFNFSASWQFLPKATWPNRSSIITSRKWNPEIERVRKMVKTSLGEPFSENLPRWCQLKEKEPDFATIEKGEKLFTTQHAPPTWSTLTYANDDFDQNRWKYLTKFEHLEVFTKSSCSISTKLYIKLRHFSFLQIALQHLYSNWNVYFKWNVHWNLIFFQKNVSFWY